MRKIGDKIHCCRKKNEINQWGFVIFNITLIRLGDDTHFLDNASERTERYTSSDKKRGKILAVIVCMVSITKIPF